MASVTSVYINPLNFTLASLAPLSLVRSAAISMSVSQSSTLIELCSLKTGISFSNELMRFDCFCVVHKVSAYCCVTSLEGSTGVGGGGWWSAIERFWSSHSIWSKVSAGCPSPAATHWSHWCKSFISLMSVVNLSWLLYTGSSGCPTASGPPNYGIWAVGVFIADISVLWVLCEDIQASIQEAACTSLAGSYSMHFICGTVSLISVSNLP